MEKSNRLSGFVAFLEGSPAVGGHTSLADVHENAAPAASHEFIDEVLGETKLLPHDLINVNSNFIS